MKRFSGLFENLKVFIEEEAQKAQERISAQTRSSDHSISSTDDHGSKSGSKREILLPNGVIFVTNGKELGREKKIDKKKDRKARRKATKAIVTKTVKYSQWTSSVEKKIKSILHELDTSKSTITGKPTHKIFARKSASLTLQELHALLEVDGFTYDDYNTNSRGHKNVRELMLELWKQLLSIIESTDEPSQDLNNVYKTVVATMRRREFDNGHLFLDVHNRPQCPENELELAHQYRTLLYKTQLLVAKKLSVSGISYTKAHFLYVFSAKVLAVTYWRVPGINQNMITSVALSSKLQKDLTKYLEDLGYPTDAFPFSDVSTNRSEVASSAFPSLFQWTLYHDALLKHSMDKLDDELNSVSKDWLLLFGKREALFYLFLKEWIGHIVSIIGDVEMDWRGIKGYTPMLLAFLHQLKSSDMIFKPLVEASLALMVHTEPSLINIYMRMIFSKTNAYAPSAVIDCLNVVDAWFKEFKNNDLNLPSNFDIEYFSKAVDVIISTDHHQLICKTLLLIYNYAEIFDGEPRKALFSELLFKRHFFGLFLHWDDAVRNSFQQLIVFKTLRAKRSVLHTEGLVCMDELAHRERGSRRSNPDPNELEANGQYLDVVLFAKIESFVKLIQEQMRNPSLDHFPKSMEVYVPRALSDYKMYMSRYYAWERSGESEPPKLTPLHILGNNIDNI